MTQGTIGWLCPKCGAVYAPWERTCAACAVAKAVPSVTVGIGTITTFSPWSAVSGASHGTVFFGPLSTPPLTPVRDWKDERAEQVVKTWNGGKWSVLQELIAEALEDAIED